MSKATPGQRAAGANNANGSHGNAAPATPLTGRRRTPWPLVIVATLFVVVPFMTWYGTWFGRELSDKDIENYLAETDKPRHAQHALSQIGDQIIAGKESARRWYPRVVELGASPVTDLRMTAAWVMGQDNRSEEFRAALVKLLGDPEPVVRRNAALALTRFGDDRARPELLAMLRPFAVALPAEGSVQTILPAGSRVAREAMLARVRTGDNVFEVRAPLPGRVAETLVREGETVTAGRDALVLAPDEAQVRDALVGLYYVGRGEDAAAIEPYARGVEGLPEEVKKQAALALENVKRR